jgi:hypothetical protein
MTMNAVAIYRSSTYSPGRHKNNDAAIMDAAAEQLLAAGWSVERLGEGDVEAGIIPDADLYLNMCQGSAASMQLLAVEERGATIINRPSAVLGCHRHRLVRTLDASGLPFPDTILLPTHDAPLFETELPDGDVWVKRGDVHAQEAADVVRTSRADLAGVIETFAERGVKQVAVQAHVAGPVLKFYGVGDGSLFHAFREDGRPVDGDTVDLASLRRLAFSAARAVGLSVFGGDAVVPSRTNPMLVDLNDWPSFAPVREQAAIAIAQLAGSAVMQRSVR